MAFTMPGRRRGGASGLSGWRSVRGPLRGAAPRLCAQGAGCRQRAWRPCRGNIRRVRCGNAPVPGRVPWSTDRERHGGEFAAHGETGLAPQRFRHAEIAAQPIRRRRRAPARSDPGAANTASASAPAAAVRPERCRSTMPCPAFRLTGVEDWGTGFGPAATCVGCDYSILLRFRVGL